MRAVTIAAFAVLGMLGLAGCGAAMQGASARDAFSITLDDGRQVQCVQVTGHGGDVAVTCDFGGNR